jgi:hypothetical protein
MHFMGIILTGNKTNSIRKNCFLGGMGKTISRKTRKIKTILKGPKIIYLILIKINLPEI